jgi:hypothetical protein
LSDVPENDDRLSQSEDAELPRQGLLAAMPKRTLYRVALLLAALAGIIYLRQRTTSIASCMSDAFRLPPPMEQRAPSSSIRARVVLPATPVKTP